MADNDPKRTRRRRKRSKPVDTDQLQQRALAVLEQVIETAETDPAAMAHRGGVETVIKVAEHLRRLNADLHGTFDAKALAKLSEADLDALEAAEARKGRR